MCTCEFCNSLFTPRPQVKHPRACKNCQRLRQYANERAWKGRNTDIYNKGYHAEKKQNREAVIIAIAEKLMVCLKAGVSFFGLNIEPVKLGTHISKLLIRLGIREINKLWSLKLGLILAT